MAHTPTDPATGEPTEPTPRKLLNRDDRRAQILQAAATAFARTGYAATTMGSVADQAGVTRVLVYRHFDSKESLYGAVLDQALDALRTAWGSRGDAPLADAAFRVHLTAARSHPDAYRLLWQHAATEPEFSARAQAARDLLENVVDDALAAALSGPLHAWATATLTDGLIDATLAWLDEGDPTLDDTFLRTAATGLLGQVTGWHDAATSGDPGAGPAHEANRVAD